MNDNVTRVPPPPPAEIEKPLPAYKVQQIAARQRLQQKRLIAGADVNAPLPEDNKKSGFQHRAIQQSDYVARQGEPFVRRAIGKVKGKAAKKARHAARAEAQREH
jgi:hypothetical protein